MFQLTKKYLEERGITNITKDGRIFKGDFEFAQHKVTCKHPYGKDRKYIVFMLYDPAIYKRCREKNYKGYSGGQRQILVHRAVYAWYNDECPKGYDIDHIDGNPYNNNLDNLQAITRGENLAKRKPFQTFSSHLYKKLYKELVQYAKEIKLIPWYENELPCGYEEFTKQYRNYPTQNTFVEDMKKEMYNYINEKGDKYNDFKM